MTDRFFVASDDIDVRTTLTSGQAFRWSYSSGRWYGIAGSRQTQIEQAPGGMLIYAPERDLPFWKQYFDLDYDYRSSRQRIGAFPELHESMGVLPGIRILNQPFYECLISFILSSCNNVPRIRSIIKRLSEKYGKRLDSDHAFPEPEDLAGAALCDLTACGTGYRAQYVKEASRMIADGFDERVLSTMTLEEARSALMYFPGIGVKVADCVLLYSLQKRDAFPVDTWVRKVMHEIYGRDMSDAQIRKFAAERFGMDAGLAQQYLFTAARLKAGRRDALEAL